MSLFQALLTDTGIIPPTPGQRILIIGDSIAAGRNNDTGAGPTPTAGTVKQWNGSAFIDVTTTDVVTATANNGSPWPQFGIDLNASSGEVVYLIPTGVSASMFHTFAGYTTWTKGGTNYTNMLTAASDALTALNGGSLDAICVILGINDIRVTSTIADVENAINVFFADLVADFPGIPILVSIPGRSEAAGAAFANSSRFYAVRFRLVAQALGISDVHICGNLGALVEFGGYSADNIHPNLTGDNEIGHWFANWFVNSAYSKWGRSIISSLYDASLSSGRKTLIDNFMVSQVASGNYAKLECLGIFKTTEIDNCWLDWSFLGFYASSDATFVANSHLATNGTNQHFTPTVMGGVNNKRATATNFITGVKVKTNSSAGAAILYGVQNATLAQRLAQFPSATAVLRYLNNDLTASDYAGESVFANDSLYSLARNGGTKFLLKGSTTLASVAVASTGSVSDAFALIGAYNNSAVVGSWINATYEYHFYAKYSDFDLAGFITDIETLIDNW